MSLLEIKNKKTDAVSFVTQTEWDAMERVGRGTKLFTVVRTMGQRQVVLPTGKLPTAKREPTVPPEVERMNGKKSTAADPAPHKQPEQDA